MSTKHRIGISHGPVIWVIRGGALLMIFASTYLAARAWLQTGGTSRGVTPAELEANVLGRTMKGVDRALDEALVSSGGTKYLMIVFHPDCPFCDHSLGPWKELLGLHANWRAIGVTTDHRPNALNYLNALGRDMDIVRVTPADLYRLLDFAATPVTLLLDSEGLVERAKVGRFEANMWFDP